MLSRLVCKVRGHTIEVYETGPFGLYKHAECTRCGTGVAVDPLDGIQIRGWEDE
jgi:hypothetical protein